MMYLHRLTVKTAVGDAQYAFLMDGFDKQHFVAAWYDYRMSHQNFSVEGFCDFLEGLHKQGRVRWLDYISEDYVMGEDGFPIK